MVHAQSIVGTIGNHQNAERLTIGGVWLGLWRRYRTSTLAPIGRSFGRQVHDEDGHSYMTKTVTAIIGVLLSLPSTSALAAIDRTSGLIQGFTHPLLGLDHALAMMAIGAIAGLMGGRALWLVPGAFLAAMALGAGWGLARLNLPYFETAVALSVVVLGIVVAIGRHLPLAAGATLAVLVAFPHGYAHGTEAPLDASVGGYFVGFLLAAAVLMAVGFGIEQALARLGGQAARRSRRALGAVIVLAGIGILAGWV